MSFVRSSVQQLRKQQHGVLAQELSPRPGLLAAHFHAQILGGGCILPHRVMGEQNQDAYEEVHVAILNKRATVGKAIH